MLSHARSSRCARGKSAGATRIAASSQRRSARLQPRRRACRARRAAWPRGELPGRRAAHSASVARCAAAAAPDPFHARVARRELRAWAIAMDPSARHPVVAEELKLLDEVTTVLNESPPECAVSPSEATLLDDLERACARRSARARRPRTAPRCSSSGIASRRCSISSATSRRAPQVSRDSPYFGHLRLREARQEFDVLLGKATWLAPRRADRRLAPRADLADLLSLPPGRCVRGGDRRPRARRRRRRAAHGHDPQPDARSGSRRPRASSTPTPRAPDGWRRIEREPPRLAGGEGAALRAHAAGEGRPRRLGTEPAGVRRRADKHLPDIAGLIDPEQFALITRPSSGFVVIRGTAGLGQDDGRAPPHRVPRLRGPAHRLRADAGRRVLAGAPRLREPRAAGARRRARPGADVPRVGRGAGPPRSSRRCRASCATDTPAEVHRLKLHPGAR